MHATIRKYTGKGALMDKLVPPVRDGLVPLLKRAPGFKGYSAFASEDGHIVSVSVFDDQRSATRATDQARDWITSNQRDLLPDPPEVLAGEALLHEVSKLQGGGAEMFAAVRRYDGVGSQEEAVRLTREHAMPILTGAPGFRGYYALLDERDASRAASVSLFDTREHAMAAQERVVAVMREVKIAPNPPTILAGRVVLAATAED
jgi:heme-degrading monooxygenase HmoA